jgi:WD40 repeat protein
MSTNTFVSGLDDRCARLWNITTMKELRRICSDTGNRNLTRWAVCDHWIKHWYGESVEHWISIVSHHSRWILRVAISSDGRFIAFSGGEGFFQLVIVSPPFPFVVHEGLVDQFISIYGSSSLPFRHRHVALSNQFDIIISNSINRLTHVSTLENDHTPHQTLFRDIALISCKSSTSATKTAAISIKYLKMR